jgi:hypothetical protein
MQAIPGAPLSIAAPPESPTTHESLSPPMPTVHESLDVAATDLTADLTAGNQSTGVARPQTWEELFEVDVPEAWPEVEDEEFDGRLLDEFSNAASGGPAAPIEFRESETPKDVSAWRSWPFLAALGAVVVVGLLAGLHFLGSGTPTVNRVKTDRLLADLLATTSMQTSMRYTVDDEVSGTSRTITGATNLNSLRGEYTIEEQGRTIGMLRRKGDVSYEQRVATGTKWWKTGDDEVGSAASLSETFRYPTDVLVFLEAADPKAVRSAGVEVGATGDLRHDRFIVASVPTSSRWVGPNRLKAMAQGMGGSPVGDVWYDKAGRVRTVKISTFDTKRRTMFFTTDFSKPGVAVSFVEPAPGELATVSGARDEAVRSTLQHLADRVDKERSGTSGDPDFSTFTTSRLTAFDSAVRFIEGPSRGLGEVSVLTSTNELTIAAVSATGVCFILRQSASGTVYGTLNTGTCSASDTTVTWFANW